jgi:hypothetical protein
VTALIGAVSLIILVTGLTPGVARAATAGGNSASTSIVYHGTFNASAASPKCSEKGTNNVTADYVNHDLLGVGAAYSFVVACPKGVARIMKDQAYEYFNGKRVSTGNNAHCTGCATLTSSGAALCEVGAKCAGLWQIHAVWIIGVTSKYKWTKVPAYCRISQSGQYVTCSLTSAGVEVSPVH